VWGSFALVAVFALLGWIPPLTSLALLSIPLAVPVTTAIYRNVEGPPLITALKGIARLDLIVGLLVALGAVL